MKKKNVLLNLIPIFTMVGVVIIYAVLALIVDNKFVLPKFSTIIKDMFVCLKSSNFYLSFLSTLLRTFISLAISFILAMNCAILSNKNAVFDKILSPIISLLRALPTVAVVLLLLFWTNSFIAPTIVTSLVVFPTLFTNAKTIISSIDRDVILALKTFNVDNKKIIKKVTLPQMLPQMIYSAGSGLSLNLKLMVAAEVLASTGNSLGILISNSNTNLEISKMMALVLFTVIVGVFIDLLFSHISKKVGKWQ